MEFRKLKRIRLAQTIIFFVMQSNHDIEYSGDQVLRILVSRQIIEMPRNYSA